LLLTSSRTATFLPKESKLGRMPVGIEGMANEPAAEVGRVNMLKLSGEVDMKYKLKSKIRSKRAFNFHAGEVGKQLQRKKARSRLGEK
jgi:hypothetical protein